MIDEEKFGEDMIKGEKLNFAALKVRQRLTEELWYGVQFCMEESLH